MDTVHVNERGGLAAAETVLVEPDTFLDHVGVPRVEAVLAAENQHQGRVQKLHCLCPLIGLLGIVLLGHLGDLPRAIDLVTECPVPDTVWFISAILTAQVGVVGVSCPVAILDPTKSYEA